MNEKLRLEKVTGGSVRLVEDTYTIVWRNINDITQKETSETTLTIRNSPDWFVELLTAELTKRSFTKKLKP